MAWRWLAVCREKGCGWDAVRTTAFEAEALQAQHERERPGHQANIVALDADQDTLRQPRRAQEAA